MDQGTPSPLPHTMADVAPAAAASTTIRDVLRHVARNRTVKHKTEQATLELLWFIEWRDKMHRNVDNAHVFMPRGVTAPEEKSKVFAAAARKAKVWVDWADALIRKALRGDEAAAREIHKRRLMYLAKYLAPRQRKAAKVLRAEKAARELTARRRKAAAAKRKAVDALKASPPAKRSRGM